MGKRELSWFKLVSIGDIELAKVLSRAKGQFWQSGARRGPIEVGNGVQGGSNQLNCHPWQRQNFYVLAKSLHSSKVLNSVRDSQCQGLTNKKHGSRRTISFILLKVTIYPTYIFAAYQMVHTKYGVTVATCSLVHLYMTHT